VLQAINPAVKVFYRALDVSNIEAVQSFVQDAVSWSGGNIDVLCCNAGIAPPQQLLAESDPHRWWLGFEVNVKGVYLLARFVLPVMQKQKRGHIIITSSSIILGSFPTSSSYTASKLASARLAESIHFENAHLGIRAIAIHPGGIVTRLVTDLEDKETEDWAKRASAVIRPLCTEDISLPGNTCVFLASGKADFMSGRFFDSTIGVNQILENEKAIIQHDLLKVGVRANWNASGGYVGFPMK
jgi:NAD(P)-dependent dehydrogenase (short-subunit alcohol dehydrogenase family)